MRSTRSLCNITATDQAKSLCTAFQRLRRIADLQGGRHQSVSSRQVAIDDRATRADFCRRAYSDRLNFTLHLLGGLEVGTPFIAEVRIISFNFPPKGWAFCNGQLQSIQQNQALFSVIGTAYGGNGIQSFGLPNLQGRTPVHVGGRLGSTAVGTIGGEELHTLSLNEMPIHLHALQGVNQPGTVITPGTNFLAQSGVTPAYHSAADLQPMASEAITATGGSLPHENRAPFLVLNFIIALTGIFPPRN
jgi:microcystin-dependent protein